MLGNGQLLLLAVQGPVSTKLLEELGACRRCIMMTSAAHWCRGGGRTSQGHSDTGTRDTHHAAGQQARLLSSLPNTSSQAFGRDAGELAEAPVGPSSLEDLLPSFHSSVAAAAAPIAPHRRRLGALYSIPPKSYWAFSQAKSQPLSVLYHCQSSTTVTSNRRHCTDRSAPTCIPDRRGRPKGACGW
jgi:hypothetical protein